MKIEKINGDFSICQISDFSQINYKDNYCFISKTDEENSLVCMTVNVPANTIRRDDGWKAFRIQGILDFSLVGILSKISALLAGSNIGLFAVSTYNTDYILTKNADYQRALQILSAAGYEIV